MAGGSTSRSRSRSPVKSNDRDSKRRRSPSNSDRSRSRSNRRRSRSPPRRRSRSPNRKPVRTSNKKSDYPDSRWLFVGNLSYEMTKDDLWDEFDRVGKVVAVNIPKDPRSGKPKGFAFVEFDTRRDAERAMDEYDGKKLNGRELRLDWDAGMRQKKESGRIRGGRSRSRSRSRSPKRRRSYSR